MGILVSKVAAGGILWKKMFLKISQISPENICVGVSPIKNTYFEEYLRTTASVVSFSWF